MFQPSARASFASGPKRISSIDLPTIHVTATGRQHQRQEEGDAEEAARPDFGVEQQREAEGDGVLDEHHQHVEDHVDAARSSRTDRATTWTRLSKPLNLPPVSEARFQSVNAMPTPKISREDHHGDGEQRRRQDEQRAPAPLAVDQHLADAERDAPDEIGVEHRPPVAEAERQDAGGVEDLQQADGEHEERVAGQKTR